MKIKENFVLRELCGSFVVVAVGEQTLNFKGLIKLNETGVFLWKNMAEKDVTEEELLQALLSEYEVEKDVAQTDIKEFINLLKEADLLA